MSARNCGSDNPPRCLRICRRMNQSTRGKVSSTSPAHALSDGELVASDNDCMWEGYGSEGEEATEGKRRSQKAKCKIQKSKMNTRQRDVDCLFQSVRSVTSVVNPLSSPSNS